MVYVNVIKSMYMQIHEHHVTFYVSFYNIHVVRNCLHAHISLQCTDSSNANLTLIFLNFFLVDCVLSKDDGGTFSNNLTQGIADAMGDDVLSDSHQVIIADDLPWLVVTCASDDGIYRVSIYV